MVSLVELRRTYRERFGSEPRLFQAPGRVNLIGEHTDYNQGFVLPAAINFSTVVAAGPGAYRKIRAFSKARNEERTFHLDSPREFKAGDWGSYVEGMARTLEAQGMALFGSNLVIDGDIPEGAGLSSSAALEVAVGQALVAESGLYLSRKELALVGQKAEHQYAGTHCGVMDQMCSALGVAGHALLIDCRSLDLRRVPINTPGTSLVICNSKVKHEHSISGYNDRRSECDEATQLLKQSAPQIETLRDVTEELLRTAGKQLPDILLKRVRHVVTENARTLEATEALQKGDLAALGKLMAQSHASLRDDYQVSCEELDLLVDVAAALPGCHGARMTGGGFGGCTVNWVDDAALENFRRTVSTQFSKRFGHTPDFWVTAAGDGLREL